MRKLFIITILTLFSSASYSQVKFGLKVAPSIASNRIVSDVDTSDISRNGSGVRMTLGLTFDIGFSDHVALSTGAWFTSKRAGIEYTEDVGGDVEDKAVFKLHYLQFPLTLKYFTNDITDKMRIYFQLGGLLDLNIAEDVRETTLSKTKEKEVYSDLAKPLDISSYVGAGVEYKIGETNILFGGITYTRGLTNILTKDFVFDKKDLAISTDLISLEIGIKF